VNNIKMNFKEIVSELGSTGSGQKSAVGSCEHNNIPLGSMRLVAPQVGLCSMELEMHV
jgi:hypothetical protein